jgi:RNA polymerase sigma-70 factor (ECF subfamily)
MSTITPTSRLTSAEMVREYQALIWRYLRFLGADPATADDLTQETFLEAIRRPPADRGEKALAGWLRTVARRKLSAAVRKDQHLVSEIDVDSFDVADEVWQRAHVDDQWQDRLDALDECLDTLTGRAAEAISRRYRKQQGREQIAEALSMSVEGVKTLLRRARATLSQCVEGKLKS